MRLMLVTDPHRGTESNRALISLLAGALGSAFVVQIRSRTATWSPQQMLALAVFAQDAGAAVWPNRQTWIAAHLGCEGIHESFADRSLGDRTFKVRSAPVHTERERVLAVERGATDLVVSPVFESAGKGTPCGLGFLSAVVNASPNQIVWALGGVNATNARMCIKAGAGGVAMMSALYDSTDPVGLARSLW